MKIQTTSAVGARALGLLLPLLLLLGAGVGTASAREVAVFHSPADSGESHGSERIPPGGTTTLHLYMNAGEIPSAGSEPCCAGQGDEVLGWDLTLRAADGLAIGSVEPAGDVVFHRMPDLLKMNGGRFQRGTLGPIKIADVEVLAGEDGVLSLVSLELVGPSLTLESGEAPSTIVTVPEPARGLLLLGGLALLAALAGLRRRSPLRSLGRGIGFAFLLSLAAGVDAPPALAGSAVFDFDDFPYSELENDDSPLSYVYRCGAKPYCSHRDVHRIRNDNYSGTVGTTRSGIEATFSRSGAGYDIYGVGDLVMTVGNEPDDFDVFLADFGQPMVYFEVFATLDDTEPDSEVWMVIELWSGPSATGDLIASRLFTTDLPVWPVGGTFSASAPAGQVFRSARFGAVWSEQPDCRVDCGTDFAVTHESNVDDIRVVSAPLLVGDLDSSGEVDLLDSVLLRRQLAGLPVAPPIPAVTGLKLRAAGSDALLETVEDGDAYSLAQLGSCLGIQVELSESSSSLRYDWTPPAGSEAHAYRWENHAPYVWASEAGWAFPGEVADAECSAEMAQLGEHQLVLTPCSVDVDFGSGETCAGNGGVQGWPTTVTFSIAP